MTRLRGYAVTRLRGIYRATAQLRNLVSTPRNRVSTPRNRATARLRNLVPTARNRATARLRNRVSTPRNRATAQLRNLVSTPRNRATAQLRNLAFALVVLMLAQPLFACPVCYGAPGDPMVKGTNNGVWVLLGVVGFVQVGFVAMFWSFWRRARAQKKFRDQFHVIEGGPHP